ncbi:hypothetical protein N9W78_01650 [bacterium]|nr:hypothetical protein [bacterium]
MIWLLYAILIIALTTRGLMLADAMGYRSDFALGAAVANVWILTAVYGYAFRQPILGREIWVALLWLRAIAQAPLWLFVFIPFLHELFATYRVEYGFIIIFLLLETPAFYVLYRYSAFANPIWGHQQFQAQLDALEHRLAQHAVVELQWPRLSTEKDARFNLRIQSIEGGYEVHIAKESQGQSFSFADRLATPYQVMHFIHRFPELRSLSFG